MHYLNVTNGAAAIMPGDHQQSYRRGAVTNSFIMIIAAFLVATFAAHAKAEQYGAFPACNEPSLEHRIIERYNYAEKKQWHRGYEMSLLSRMHEHSTQLWYDSMIVRRYCAATAHFSNGSKRQVYFLVEDDAGFAGMTWGITYCVLGLDPWHNHDGNCRTMR